MSKVLVDRELLEQLLDEGPRSVTWAAQEQARAILAKPEEVDGASIPLTGEYHIDCSYLMNLVDGQRAALSAVTAERDRLRKDAERYRWLREMHQSPCGLTLTIARVGMMELTGWSGDDPDSVIDAAMAAKEA